MAAKLSPAMGIFSNSALRVGLRRTRSKGFKPGIGGGRSCFRWKRQSKRPENLVLTHSAVRNPITPKVLEQLFQSYVIFISQPRTLSSGLIFQDRFLAARVDGREIVKRHERGVLHENLPRLLEQDNALFDVGNSLLLIDEFVQFRIAVIAPLGRSRAKILVIKRIGVRQRAAIVVIKGQLAAIDAFRPPQNTVHSCEISSTLKPPLTI